MSGSSLNIINYSNTGTQAQRTYNGDTIEDSVESSFVTKKDYIRKLAFGTGINEIHSSSGSSKFGSTQTFKLPDFVDAIGDIYLSMRILYKKKDASTKRQLPRFGISLLVKKITVEINGSIFQELTGSDIVSYNFTTMSANDFSHFFTLNQGYYMTEHGYVPMDNKIANDPIDSSAIIKLPIFCSGSVDNSYLKLENLNNNFIVKIEYVNTKEDAVGTFASQDKDDRVETIYSFDTALFVRSYTISNLERNLIVSNPVSKIHNFNQGISKSFGPNEAGEFGSNICSFDLSFASLLASHITIIGRFLVNNFSSILASAELLFDGESYCGKVPGNLLLVASDKQHDVVSTSTTDESGKLFNCYILQVASKFFSADGIPFNKYAKIELKLEFKQKTVAGIIYKKPAQISVTVFGTKALVYNNGVSSVPF